MKKSAFILFLLFISFYAFSQNSKQQDISKNLNNVTKALSENNVWGKKILIGHSKEGNPLYGYYYNRGGTDKAMIIAGVHGSEFYGVDVALSLKENLDKLNVNKFKWKVLIIPEIFSDNVKKGRDSIFKFNYGRITDCKGCVDPNRQMPKVGEVYKIGDTLAYNNKGIEVENQYLLHITQQYNPSRIASLHCKNGGPDWLEDKKDRDLYKQIGIYSDPRTDNNNIALGFYDDAVLPIRMAVSVKENGGIIYGNFVDEKYVKDNDGNFKLKKISYLNPVYPKDPAAVDKDNLQQRTYEDEDSEGVSFGTWASTEIKKNDKIIKKAATILTVELPQYYYFFGKKDDLSTIDREKLNKNTSAYVKALRNIFLEDK